MERDTGLGGRFSCSSPIISHNTFLVDISLFVVPHQNPSACEIIDLRAAKVVALPRVGGLRDRYEWRGAA